MTEKRPDADRLLKELTQSDEQKNKGKLKIFFGYSAGVGKTYAMLEEAHALKNAGVDVVIGYVEQHQRPATLALIEGLPQIPPVPVTYKSATFYEFDIDSALKRRPKLILVDELAHTNANGCRHLKRYQDVEELLRMGIDVYTTINVQHIEGLHDVVQSITGIAVRERIPDSVFDSAHKVELIDIEPEDLINRLGEGKIYKETQAAQALQNFFTKDNLIALREIALRRTADRVNIAVEKNKTSSQHTEYYTDEHILMCLSSSPSNPKVIRTAAKMAEAFHGTFTALFVESPDYSEMSEENKKRLRDNLRLAEQLGAKIATVYGDNIAYQVAEYAKVSGVSKIVMGRPVSKFIFGIKQQNSVDRLTAYAPNLEIYVIPNKMTETFQSTERRRFKPPAFTFTDTLRAIMCLVIATLIGFLFQYLGFSESNIITVYILASLFTAVITNGKVYSLISSIFAVLLFNFFFTDPTLSLSAYDPGYPVTFVIMFASAFITSTFTKRVKDQARQSAMNARRTDILLETSQKLQLCKDKNGIILESIRQIQKLLDKAIIIYPVVNGTLGDAITQDSQKDAEYLTTDEYAVAQWVFTNNKHAGASTNTLSGAKCLYMSVRSGNNVFAVIGIPMVRNEKLDSLDKSLLVAMLAESALALEKENLLLAKNEMAIKVNREELRSNLLRAISHDLRTPLTGIAGGSSFLLENLETLDKQTLKLMLDDITTDALWLSNLVENLLNMTRIQDGRLTVTKKNELVDEVVSAALSKVMKRSKSKSVKINKPDELIFVPMDAQLMMQVIINLLDNAFKHTKPNSVINLDCEQKDNHFVFSVSDNGGGIPKERIGKIFEPFYTTSNLSDDKQRGMGLGLSICKSIVEAHRGSIKVKNNNEGGATFTVTLPMS